MREIKISVRSLVEFVLRSGDIEHRFVSQSRALEGTRLHQKVQKNYGEGFEAEVALSLDIPFQGNHLILEGRCDGIYRGEDGVLVDEIKSTHRSREELEAHPNQVHWAQVALYGYILCTQEDLDEITLRLTYITLEDEAVFQFERTMDADELKDEAHSIIEKYLSLLKVLQDFEENSIQSIKKLTFPYGDFRKGQRELAVSVYNMIQNKDQLLVEAPTGIGKTMATLFPSIKAMGEELIDRIYYATGRGTQQQIAEDAYDKLTSNGLLLKSLTLTAKEKLCLNEEVHCHPDHCPYAKGHFDRVNEVIFDLLEHCHQVRASDLLEYAKEFLVCPFELQLDMIPFSQLVIGDYNYIFHPRIQLETLEQRARESILLVDEAHNLLDRGRQMYSLSLTVDEIEAVLALPEVSSKMKNRLQKLVEFICEKREVSSIYPERLHNQLTRLAAAMERELTKNDEDLPQVYLDLYFKVLEWLNLEEYYHEEDFVFYSPTEGEIQILCLDTHQVVRDKIRPYHAAVFFSATLSPKSYYTYFLGLSAEAKSLTLSSPFDPNHFLVLHPRDIKTTYRHRSDSVASIGEILRTMVESEPGNYLFFFPSYAFLNEVYEHTKSWDEHALLQSPQMTMGDREDFLNQFKKKPVHGYVVMGGVFSEGIDLVGEDLVGGAVISLGLPGLSPERELMKDNFNRKGLAGYDYSYTIPGMTKVIQSAGRIIRAKEDRGVLILMDQRYGQQKIRNLLPAHWQIHTVNGIRPLTEKINEFWRNYDT